MEFEEQYARVLSSPQRPATLSKLCMVSFFFSGSMTLFSFGGLFFSGWLSDYLMSFKEGFYGIGPSYFAIFFSGMFVLFGSSFTGVLLMFRLKRSGFWIYFTANIIMVFLSFFVVMTFFNGVFILGSVVFIILYARQRKHLR